MLSARREAAAVRTVKAVSVSKLANVSKPARAVNTGKVPRVETRVAGKVVECLTLESWRCK